MDKYTVGQELGSGSYAKVYLGTEKATGKQWALKFLNKAEAGVQGLKAAQAEIDILRSCRHQNIIQMYDTFETADSLVMVLELVKGGELFDKIVALKHYSEDTAAKLARNLCICMKYMCDQGVAHRDIKPENLMLAQKHVQGETLTEEMLTDIKLVDYGFAIRFKEKPFVECCGTPNFIAPEILQFGVFKTLPHGYDEKCDMWSIGVLVYILLCGYPPFYDKKRNNLFKKICQGKFYFHQGTVWDHISDEAKDFVMRLMVLDPKKRSSAEQALQHSWLATARSDVDLPETKSNLEMFNAREKVKGAVYGIGAATRLLWLQKCKGLGAKPNTGLDAAFVEMSSADDTLDQSNNYLGRKGIQALMSVVSDLRIKNLNLSDNQIDNETVNILVQGVKSHPTLQRIDLRKNPVSLLGARALLGLLQINHRIIWLELDYDEAFIAYRAKIEAQLQRNRAAQP